MVEFSPSDFQALAELRFQVRRFLHFSEQQARAHGIEPQQHQLLLALKGLPSGRKPVIRELAARLQLRHHSVVELVDRLERRGAVARTHCLEDRREVLVQLTPIGEQVLRELSILHRQELESLGPEFSRALRRVIPRARRAGRTAA